MNLAQAQMYGHSICDSDALQTASIFVERFVKRICHRILSVEASFVTQKLPQLT